MDKKTPWIICRMGKKLYMLAKDERAYYIIEAGKNRDHATEEWLEQHGVSEELLKELVMPFEYIPRKVLTSVGFSGYQSGDTLYLYLKNGKRVLELAEDVKNAFLRDFFSGIPRSKIPKETPEKYNPGWRKAKRDPALYRKLKPVPAVLMTLSAVAILGYWNTGNAFWFTLLLVALFAPIQLDILMPSYFTLFFEEKAKKRDALGLDMVVLVNMCALIFRTPANWLCDVSYWLVIGGCGSFTAALCMLAEEFRRRKLGLLAAMFMGGIFGIFLVAHINEVYAPEEPQSYILEVEETHKSHGSKSTSYYCTVTLPDGREESLNIPRKLYDSLEEGNLVRVEVGEGVFGIEYANVYPYEEGG